MGSSVEFYLKYAGEGQGLAHHVAQVLDVVSYFYSGEGYGLPVDAQRWIGVEGWGHLGLEQTDLGRYGEPGIAEETAFGPYEYELPLSFRGGGPGDRDEMLLRFGRAIFDRLTTVGRPLAFGGSGLIFADFLPGRGVREFPPKTDAEEAGRTWWYEPRLHEPRLDGVPTSAWPGELAPLLGQQSGPVTVFETDGLLQFVPVVAVAGQWRWYSPVASTRSSVDPRDIGLMLSYAQRTMAGPGGDESDRILRSLAERTQLSMADFAARSVSVQLRTDASGLVAVPHAPGAGQQLTGAAVDALAARLGTPAPPQVLGQFLIGLVTAVRAEVSSGR